ncbi:MAG: UMP kinase [Candidatus Aenigmarchaeota archaeon]|nr:UMP kinase [Candidatus Aenigmarchaeota archaeon]
MKIVISLGGSLLTKELAAEHFKKYIDVVKELSKEHKLIVIVGGGKVCREYQKVGRELGADSDQQDFIGIMSTHLNASTFVSGLGKNAYFVRWKPLKEAVKEVKKNFGRKIVVAAGHDTGSSTDHDAAVFASAVKADLLVNASNVAGVYSDDPKANPNAKKYDKLTYGEFLKIIKKNSQTPGEYRLFDLKAANVIVKHKIRTVLIDGNNPREIIKAVNGQHNGTVVG